ncbi:hypothetical protein AB1Y20_021814 [Prymnesium parvum]|uniref:Conserved oligomeric Golgi complex subunit 8 n=1 Tax=Prymnesium parvum TaxID=97485 RepID=A0AB34JMI2_PRYPA
MPPTDEPTSLRDALASSSASIPPDQLDALLDELAGLTLEQIRRRPAQLRATLTGLRAQLAGLLHGSAPAFVQSAHSLTQVHEHTRRVHEHLQALERRLPAAADEAAALADALTQHAALREQHALLLEQLPGVVEVLEQPQLMDACVRNGMIDEALELEAAVRSAALLHADVPLLVRTAADVSAQLLSLRDALLAQLCAPLKLPAALSCVGYLRRLPPPYAMGDAELRAAFLSSRDVFFSQLETGLARDSAASYLLKYIDLCRVHWYDVVTQYRALFGAEKSVGVADGGLPNDPAVRSSDGARRSVVVPEGGGSHVIVMGRSGTARMAPLPAGAKCGERVEVEMPTDASFGEQLADELAPPDQLGRLLLSGWAAGRVAHLLLTVETSLPQVQEGPYLAHLMEQCATCGASLALVGLDFTPLVRHHFRHAIFSLLQSGCEAALEHWREALSAYRWNAPIPPPPTDARRSADAPPLAAGGKRAAPPPPPLAMLQHPPVGVLLNHFLTVFNELRQCMPYELRPQVFERVGEALLQAVGCLAALPARPSFSKQAEEHYRSFCACMAAHLLPYLVASLEVLAWKPPVEWGRQYSEADAPDGLGEALSRKVTAALQPLFSTPPAEAPSPEPPASHPRPSNQLRAAPADAMAAEPSSRASAHDGAVGNPERGHAAAEDA